MIILCVANRKEETQQQQQQHVQKGRGLLQQQHITAIVPLHYSTQTADSMILILTYFYNIYSSHQHPFPFGLEGATPLRGLGVAFSTP